MVQILAKSFKDIFSFSVLLFVGKVTVISVVLTAIFLLFFSGVLTAFISSYLSWVPWEWVRTTGASVGTIAAAYMIFIMVLSTFTSLMVEPLLIKLAKKHYPNSPVIGKANITTSLLIIWQYQ